MKNNCSRCNGDDPSCYVCHDRQIAEEIAQLEYAFEMHKMCCEHFNLDPDNDSEGDTLLEAICRDEGAGRDKERIKELLDMLKRVRKHGGIENLAQLDEMDELIERSNLP
jgi:hypothetical protein